MIKKILSQLLVKLFIRKSKIVQKEIIAERFIFLKIKTPKKITWIAGDKVQIVVGKKDLRSYTPYALDEDQKTFSTLIYNHGNGPGALWASEVLSQTKMEVFGPRRSFVDPAINNNDSCQMSYLFFGDETSMGLAYALRSKLAQAYFEVNDEAKSHRALHYLGLKNYVLFKRKPHYQHLKLIVEQMTSLLHSQPQAKLAVILSGHKLSAEELERSLSEEFQRLALTNIRLLRKHYWGHKDLKNLKEKNHEPLKNE